MSIRLISVLRACDHSLSICLNVLSHEVSDYSSAREAVLIAGGLLSAIQSDLVVDEVDGESKTQWATIILGLKSANSALEVLKDDVANPAMPSTSTLPVTLSSSAPSALTYTENDSGCQPRITFSNICGHESAKSALFDNVILHFTIPDHLRARLLTGVRACCGNVLLYGPPGTGKTSLAMAAANEARARLFIINPSSVLSKYVGSSERTLRAIFVTARRSGNSIIFFDEFDSIALSRGTSDEGIQARRLLSELLMQMTAAKHHAQSLAVSPLRGICADFDKENSHDSSTPPPLGSGSNPSSSPPPPPFPNTQNVVVLAATNRMGDLDEAIIRRFESRIHVGLPDSGERGQLILRFLEGLQHKITCSELDDLAEMSFGWSGADLESWTRESSMGPVRRLIRRVGAAGLEMNECHDLFITIDDFRAGREKMLQINETRGIGIDEEL